MRTAFHDRRWLAGWIMVVVALLASPGNADEPKGLLRGRIVDADSDRPIPARLYIRSRNGRWFTARSAAEEGSAVEYRKQRGTQSVEIHTTLSAHPFVAELPPGRYTLIAERGKEYHTARVDVEVGGGPVEATLRLRRWINMAERGWFSGDTHVHRSLDELPNVLLAEDLNVALPLTDWVAVAGIAPTQAGRERAHGPEQPRLITVDPTHVIWPLNTEYEITQVNGRRHVLGAVFVLDQKRRFDVGVPPVTPVAEEAHRQGALLDLDKHSWPWSLMLVPVMDVDLFELTNNHVWRTAFFFRQWSFGKPPPFPGIERTAEGFTERGWIEFGLRTWYALLNCGFRLRPSAGTASGVHPVPLGYGRVYVFLPDGFSYKKWMAGLDAGRSFVTTGPMLLATFNGHPPGHTVQLPEGSKVTCRISGTVLSSRPVERIEIVLNGEIAATLKPSNAARDNGAFQSPFETTVHSDGSCWVSVRCFERQPDGRYRFAHTGTAHFDVSGSPLRPRKLDVDWFVERMEEEYRRNEGILSGPALAEFQKALDAYRRLQHDAR